MPPKKRKAAPTKTEPKPKSKQAKREVGDTKTNGKNGEILSATPKQLLTFLLSSKSVPYCYPNDELEAAETSTKSKSKSKTTKTKDTKIKSYSKTSPSEFTAFENLLIAHLLSKPLSHTLGMRSIRTLLNEPYNLTTPEKIVKEGEKRVWEALETARTQHRQKTATYIFQMAKEYNDDETMYALAVEANDGGSGGVIEHITKTVKGMGKIGSEIFCRRIQCVDGWGDALWPFADERSLDSIKQLGIDVESADELQSAIERDIEWDDVGDMGMNERVNYGKEEDKMELQVQAEFVIALERAVGCVLEGKVEEFKKAALG